MADQHQPDPSEGDTAPVRPETPAAPDPATPDPGAPAAPPPSYDPVPGDGRAGHPTSAPASRWTRWRRPVGLAAAALGLVLLGGVAGFAIGHAAGDDGRPGPGPHRTWDGQGRRGPGGGPGGPGQQPGQFPGGQLGQGDQQQAPTPESTPDEGSEQNG